MAVPARETIDCDVGAALADAATIDALARLELVARGRGRSVRFCNASSELVELVAFVGLGDVLRLEPRRKPEERE